MPHDDEDDSAESEISVSDSERETENADLLENGLGHAIIDATPEEMYAAASRALLKLSKQLTTATPGQADAIMDRVMDILTHFTEQETHTLMAEAAFPARATEPNMDDAGPAMEMAVLEALPRELSYEQALRLLPPNVYERDLLTGGFGESLDEVLSMLRIMNVEEVVLNAIADMYDHRAFLYDLWGKNRHLDVTQFHFITDGPRRPQVIFSQPVREASQRRFQRRSSLATKYPSLVPVSLEAKLGEKLKAADLYDRRYEELIKNIINDALLIFEDLEIKVFPKVVGGSIKDIARIYGPVLTSKVRGGQLRYDGCRAHWRRLLRILDLAVNFGRLDLSLLLNFLDISLKSGGSEILWTRTDWRTAQGDRTPE